jgi:hypothetical protein
VISFILARRLASAAACYGGLIVIALPLVLLLVVQAAGLAPAVVQAPDSPVRLDRAKILNVVPDEPAVLLYAATNLTDYQLEQFTVTLFIFDAQGQLKARQLAPGRRTLDARSTKFSSMVLDVGAIGATDILVVGVNQAQRADSEQWWRADLQSAAEAAAKRKVP